MSASAATYERDDYAHDDDFGARLPDVVPIHFDHGEVVLARGLQVGALFVRAAFAGEWAKSTGDMVPAQRGALVDLDRHWIVEVPHLQISLLAANSFSTALLVADEVSRFSRHDLFTARSDDHVLETIGPELVGWLTYLARMPGIRPPTFREWSASKKRCPTT